MNINKDLINQFRASKKPTKKEIINKLEVFIENDDKSQVEYLLASLLDYLYIKPNKKACETDLIQWSLQAVSKDKLRYMLMNAFIDNGDLVSTDGKRLHIAKGVMIKSDTGKYLSPQNAIIEQSGKYPNYKQIIPDRTLWESIDLSDNYIDQFEGKSVINIKHGDKCICFNHEFYKQAMAYQIKDTKYYIYHNFLIIESSEHFALIGDIRREY